MYAAPDRIFNSMSRLLYAPVVVSFSVSLLFVVVESFSESPPLKHLNFTWETPFRLSLTWERPEDLSPECKVNFTLSVTFSQVCSLNDPKRIQKRIQSNKHTLNISNENGLCINVTTNIEQCHDPPKIPPKIFVIPPPSVTLVKNRRYEYSHNKLKCMWKPALDVKDLKFYYWFPPNNSIIQCVPDETLSFEACIIHSPSVSSDMLFLFTGTYNGTVVSNTFMSDPPIYYVKFKKPQLTIQRKQDFLQFLPNASDLNEFAEHCYLYNYTYSVCDKNIEMKSSEKSDAPPEVQYDPFCKYRAQVQIIFKNSCGRGSSDVSDVVEFGQNQDPKHYVLLVAIIIPLIVSCCFILSLVLLRRHKDIIFPRIPDPSLLFKEMLINNVSLSDELQQSPAAARLYVPSEEVVEFTISHDV